ncbi:hypothetical protein D3C85_1635200 [compost metagenome]
MMGQRHADRLHGVEFGQPACQVTAHNVSVRVIFPTFAVDDDQVTQTVLLGLLNKRKKQLTALFDRLAQ